jgi:hypothetical protein
MVDFNNQNMGATPGNPAQVTPPSGRATEFITPPAEIVLQPGSLQEMLRRNIGNYVVVDFLIGTQNITSRQGILFDVGISYLIIYNPADETYILCDMYSVKFVTFYPPNRRPAATAARAATTTPRR